MTKIKIASWNINSVRLRAPQIADFAKDAAPDIIAIQEIKCMEDQFPREEFLAMGYPHMEISGQKGMHGAATVSKIPLTRMDTQFCPREEARHVSTIVTPHGAKPFELHNFYIPAGGDEADPETNPKFAHKLGFLDTMTKYFTARASENARQVLVGDFNIAPHENDVWSHKQLLKVISHTPLEVDILNTLLACGDFTDCARAHLEDDEKLFSWWSYRSRDINKSDRGRRLDHIWVSAALKDAALSSGKDGHEVHRHCRFWERPSDHAPVTQILDLD
ncbi:MAG: exodeoxyribonuclease III [Robiginitomaculum sp.]|nr:MAG: exodeoxyribonuclease III [Robiginitomaculum sp.]